MSTTQSSTTTTSTISPATAEPPSATGVSTAQTPNSPTTNGADETPLSSPSLPELSASDRQIYDKLSVMMNYYHTHFRRTWRTLYTACETNTRPSGVSLHQFLSMGLQFVHHITIHHDIEEQHIFPVLGKKMPEFAHHPTGDNKRDPRAKLMVLQHKQIHAGLDLLETYLEDCKSRRKDFRLQGQDSLKEVMDSFGGVLWEHLDEEVRLLGADNMRMYWTTKEMMGFNW